MIPADFISYNYIMLNSKLELFTYFSTLVSQECPNKSNNNNNNERATIMMFVPKDPL